MARPRTRNRLDTGICLDVNVMVRASLESGTYKLSLADAQEVVVDLRMDHRDPRGWLRLQIPGFGQTLGLTAVPRPFGGRQWYWVCPLTGERASVLWMPRGCNVFASQRYWRGRKMAYGSQFLSPSDRAHRGIRRIEARLGSKEDEDTLYKPKWQRWGTFNRFCERLDAYESVIEDRLVGVVGRLMERC